MNTLSVIIPVYNEERTIAAVLEKVLSADAGSWSKEIIVVDDHSTDLTRQQLKPFSDKITFVRHAKNLGKGVAVRTGLAQANGSVIIMQDADLEYDPADWKSMLALLADPAVTAVFGSRNLHSERQGYRHFVWGVAFLTWLTNVLYGSRLTDIYTCYKLVRADVLRSCALQSRGFEVEAEITCKILKRRLLIAEVPISYDPRTFAEGKKIRFRDGLIGLRTILQERFRP